MTEPILKLTNLEKRFGKVVVANSLNFEVPKGGALGIVGPNGAGKSTLLNLINGNEKLDGGNIEFKGQSLIDVGSPERAKLGIARTFQIPRPFSGMTVFENVLVASTFGANGNSSNSKTDLALEAIEKSGMMDFYNTPASKLRLLDRKRLELARALASGPELILLDEIAGGLTDSELPMLIQTIKDLVKAGITVIWIEHIVHALVSVVDELMCIAGGEIIAIGNPEKVLGDSRVVELYLGDDFEGVER